jgi:hypothetical protein
MRVNCFVPITICVMFKGCNMWCSSNKLQFFIHRCWHVMGFFLMLHSQTCINDIHGYVPINTQFYVLNFVSWYSRSLQQRNIPRMFIFYFIFSLAVQPSVGYGLLVPRGFVITHNDAPQSVGLLWTSEQLVAETSTWQHTTHTTDKHPCQWWHSNPWLQKVSSRRPMP